jgi:hypothetical protein
MSVIKSEVVGTFNQLNCLVASIVAAAFSFHLGHRYFRELSQLLFNFLLLTILAFHQFIDHRLVVESVERFAALLGAVDGFECHLRLY